MKTSSSFRNKTSETIFFDCPVNKQGRNTVKVRTYKQGNQIVSHYQWGEIEQGDGYSTFSFIMYQDDSGRIHVESFKRITDAMIQKQHNEAVAIFMQRNGWRTEP